MGSLSCLRVVVAAFDQEAIIHQKSLYVCFSISAEICFEMLRDAEDGRLLVDELTLVPPQISA